ncbi:MAG TPA: class I SAM-dependent methyltransferase [Gaiellaceae bacterium]|nr:class I SAM-dependent methyltransferase [Gaiellaceae bacterium]
MTLRANQAGRDRWVESIAARTRPGATVLDVGAGECRYRPLFDHCDYRAHDFASYEGTTDGLFAEPWEYGRLDYVSDITDIPVDGDTFDVVLCTEVLEHVPRPLDAIRELARITRLGGKVYLSAPLGSGLHQEPFHFYGGFTPHFYEYAFSDCGLVTDSIAANGGFFQQLAQELERAQSIRAVCAPELRRKPLGLLLRLMASHAVTSRLLALDDRLRIREFTVGYHVEATKVPVPS